jgi:tetratricopeptide (TPR) repeat protein
MAWANHGLGRNNEALDKYREAIMLRDQIGMDATETMYSQAVTLQSLGQLDNALTLLEQTSLNVQEGKCRDQKLAANISKSIGLVHLQKGQFQQAVSALTQAWRLETQCLGTIHPNTANTIANLGVVYSHLGKISKSIKLNQLALHIKRHCGGKGDEEVADVHHNLACALLQSERRSRHKADITHHLKRSLHLYSKVSGVKTEKTRRTRELFMGRKMKMKGCRSVSKAMDRHQPERK